MDHIQEVLESVPPCCLQHSRNLIIEDHRTLCSKPPRNRLLPPKVLNTPRCPLVLISWTAFKWSMKVNLFPIPLFLSFRNRRTRRARPNPGDSRADVPSRRPSGSRACIPRRRSADRRRARCGTSRGATPTSSSVARVRRKSVGGGALGERWESMGGGLANIEIGLRGWSRSGRVHLSLYCPMLMGKLVYVILHPELHSKDSSRAVPRSRDSAAEELKHRLKKALRFEHHDHGNDDQEDHAARHQRWCF